MDKKQKYVWESSLWDELSYNFVVVILIFVCYLLKVSNVILCCLLIVLIMIIFVNFFLLSLGFQRQFILKRDPKISSFMFFIKYWIYFRIIGPFLSYNTISTIYRYLTYPFRSYPDIYFLGPKKVGSTTLTHHLLSIGLKGPYTYWNNIYLIEKESNFYSGFLGLSTLFSHHSVYKLHFPLKFIRNIFFKNTLYFDADPGYFHLPHIRDRIYKSTPNAKFLVLIRDPIKRTISNFKHENKLNETFKSFGLAQNPSFDNNIKKMIDIEQTKLIKEERKKLENLSVDEKLPNTLNLVDRFSLIEQSLYGKHLKWWTQKFAKKQFYIIDLNELNKNLHNELEKICTFLNYPITKQQILKCKHLHINQHHENKCKQIDQNTVELIRNLIKKDTNDFQSNLWKTYNLLHK